MKIETLEYHDRESGWTLAPTKFAPDLNLLVGVSGVGKTRILEAISNLRRIADNDDDFRPWGVEWKVVFSLNDARYEWSGKFIDRGQEEGEEEDQETITLDFLEYESDQHPCLVYEKLSRSDDLIAERDESNITFQKEKTLKFPAHESLLWIFREEDSVRDLQKGFDRILNVDHSRISHPREQIPFSSVRRFKRLRNELHDLDAIRNSKLGTRTKLLVAESNAPGIFCEIVDRFKLAFPQVDGMTVKTTLPNYRDGLCFLALTERGVSKPIPEHKISSGMMRTLMHIARMYLWPDGMVVLIDEFENSLGVNCIDSVTENLVEESRRQQFIITSHHPYIINNVDTCYWKLVERDGDIVSTRTADELGLSESSHSAFMQLINLSEFTEGIAVE